MTRLFTRVGKRIVSLLLMIAAAVTVSAQDVESYKFDIGGGLGVSGYLGDANRSNLFKHIGFAGNLEGRYLIDSRWSLRAQFTFATLSGNTADWDNVLPGGAQYKFNASVFDLGFRGEFNFFAYGIGETYRRLRRWSPFLSLGIGGTLSSCGGSMAGGFNIPMGMGVRFKINRRLNLSAEFTMTKTFSDKIDGKELDDLYGIKSSFIKNTDWYSTFMVGISYEFGPRCVTCHRID